MDWLAYVNIPQVHNQKYETTYKKKKLFDSSDDGTVTFKRNNLGASVI